jgi:hypothetical protein
MQLHCKYKGTCKCHLCDSHAADLIVEDKLFMREMILTTNALLLTQALLVCLYSNAKQRPALARLYTLNLIPFSRYDSSTTRKSTQWMLLRLITNS